MLFLLKEEFFLKTFSNNFFYPKNARKEYFMRQTQYETYHETKKHTSEDFPYNTYLCSIPLDFTRVPTHWHTEMEIIAIKKGEGIVSVNLVPYQVKAGDFIIVLPGCLHSISALGYALMEYENILFKPEMLKSRNTDSCNLDCLNPLLNGYVNFPERIHSKLEYYNSIRSCIDQMDEFSRDKPSGYQMGIKGCLMILLFHLYTNNTKMTQIKPKKSLEKLKLVLDYIHNNYQNQITIEEIADICHYSPSHFMKFFKETMGCGFVQYLNDYRLTLAAKLLQTTDDNILEISHQTGFENLSYFNRLFKRKYNRTPTTYREQNSFQKTLLSPNEML